MAIRRIPRMTPVSAEEREVTKQASRGRAKRFAELFRIARTHGLVPFGRLDFTNDVATASLRRTQAEGLRRALEQAGGAWVKMGQLLSTRNDILPPEWGEALSHLQRAVTPARRDDVKAMLEKDLRAPLESVFESFDADPIAAASIGQVHRATLLSGQRVAVKVLRPGIVPAVRRDVEIALRFTRFLHATSPQARELGIRDVAQQYGADLLRQVDFRLEALNLSAMRAMQSRRERDGELYLPRLYEEYSTDRMIVMEYLDGETITEWRIRHADDRSNLDEPIRSVLRSFVRQISFDGIYHSDLHPGNIMLLPDGRTALVDFGSVGRLDLALRETIQELVIAYLQADNQLIADALLSLAPLRPGADEVGFRRDLSAFITLELGPGARVDVRTVDALVAIVGQYGMAVPAELVAAARGFAILEGTVRATMPEFDLIEEARNLAGEQIREQMEIGNVRDLLSKELLALLPAVRRLPRRFDQIGEALETGRLNVNVRLLADVRDRRLLAGLIRQLVTGGVGATAGVLSLGYLTGPEGDGVISTVTAGGVLGVASIVLLVAAAVDALLTRRR